jgi:hypothetical protein
MMRRELTKLGVGIALVLLINAGITHFYLSTFMRENIAARTEAQFNEYRAGLKTLILGDSHSKWGVDARLLDSAFNVSLPGRVYMQDFYLLRSFLDRGLIDPQFVILGLDLYSFTERPLGQWGFLRFYTRYINYVEEGWRRGELLYYTMRQVQGRFAPYAGQRAETLHFLAFGRPLTLAHLTQVPMERGALILPSWHERVPVAERQRLARIGALVQLNRRDPFHPRHVEDFLRLLDLCHERKIRVLLIKFPMSAEYLAAAEAYTDIQKHNRRTDELLKGRTGVAVLHTRTKFADRPDLFTDATHLDSTGAKVLAAEINRALDSLAKQPW